MLRVRFIDGEVIEYPDANAAEPEDRVIELYNDQPEIKYWIATLSIENVKAIEDGEGRFEDPIIITK